MKNKVKFEKKKNIAFNHFALMVNYACKMNYLLLWVVLVGLTFDDVEKTTSALFKISCYKSTWLSFQILFSYIRCVMFYITYVSMCLFLINF